MTTRVISIRLPSTAYSALVRSAANAGWSVSTGLDCLLQNSIENAHLLHTLTDCLDFLDTKLDVRIPIVTSEQLRSKTQELGMPLSVYIRKLLYHFYITKKLRYVACDGHYTLAGRHD